MRDVEIDARTHMVKSVPGQATGAQRPARPGRVADGPRRRCWNGWNEHGERFDEQVLRAGGPARLLQDGQRFASFVVAESRLAEGDMRALVLRLQDPLLDVLFAERLAGGVAIMGAALCRIRFYAAYVRPGTQGEPRAHLACGIIRAAGGS
jgi:hypothetical protein